MLDLDGVKEIFKVLDAIKNQNSKQPQLKDTSFNCIMGVLQSIGYKEFIDYYLHVCAKGENYR